MRPVSMALALLALSASWPAGAQIWQPDAPLLTVRAGDAEKPVRVERAGGTIHVRSPPLALGVQVRLDAAPALIPCDGCTVTTPCDVARRGGWVPIPAAAPVDVDIQLL